MPPVERLSIAQARLVIAGTSKRKRQKYGAKPCRIDGHYFPSQLEGNRYGILRILERSGKIRNLKLQPHFPLEVNGVVVGEYRADFAYQEPDATGGTIEHWHDVVEDAKGMRLPLYKLKRALFLVQHPFIVFREISK